MTTSRWHMRLLFLLVATVYLAALAYRHDAVPGPPCNEVAEEALSGYLMIHSGDPAAIYTALNPNGHEALHVLAIGALAHLLPGDPLAILIPAWISAIGLLALLRWFARLNSEIVDEVIVVAFAAACLWLFHYARTGLRTVSAPAFLVLFVILLQLSWNRPPGRMDLLAGAALALGPYAYSSMRLAVLALAAFALIELWRASRRSPEELRLRFKKLALVTAGFLLTFSWALVQAFRQPDTFFGRGLYVYRGGPMEQVANLLWSVLLPVHYSDRYLALAGPGHVFDSVALALPAAHLAAVPLLLGILSLLGLIIAAKRHVGHPAFRFLLVFYALFIVVLGIAGPSLTRLFAVFPVVVICGAIALGRVVRDRRQVRLGVAVTLYAVAAYGALAYLRSGIMPDPTRHDGAAMAASVGRRARTLCEQGGTPLCVVGRERNIVRYLTIGHWDGVGLHEFHERAVRLDELRPDLDRATTVLVDDSPNLAHLVRYLTESEGYRAVRGTFYTELVRGADAPTSDAGG